MQALYELWKLLDSVLAKILATPDSNRKTTPNPGSTAFQNTPRPPVRMASHRVPGPEQSFRANSPRLQTAGPSGRLSNHLSEQWVGNQPPSQEEHRGHPQPLGKNWKPLRQHGHQSFVHKSQKVADRDFLISAHMFLWPAMAALTAPFRNVKSVGGTGLEAVIRKEKATS